MRAVLVLLLSGILLSLLPSVSADEISLLYQDWSSPLGLLNETDPDSDIVQDNVTDNNVEWNSLGNNISAYVYTNLTQNYTNITIRGHFSINESTATASVCIFKIGDDLDNCRQKPNSTYIQWYRNGGGDPDVYITQYNDTDSMGVVSWLDEADVGSDFWYIFHIDENNLSFEAYSDSGFNTQLHSESQTAGNFLYQNFSVIQSLTSENKASTENTTGYIDYVNFTTTGVVAPPAGSMFSITANNVYNATAFTIFNATMTKPGHGDWFFSTTNGTINANMTNADADSWNITVRSLRHFDSTFIDFNVSQNLDANLTEAFLRLSAQNQLTGEMLSEFNVSIPLDGKTYTTTTGTAGIQVNNATYNFTITAPGSYDASNFALDFVYFENKTHTANITPTFQFHFSDERTLGDFNMSSFDTLQLQIFCPGQTVFIDLNDTSQDVQIGYSEFNCNFTKLRFQLEYGVDLYYRTLITSPNGTNQTFYLLDLTTTTSVFNNFILFDLLAEYDDASVHLFKNIGDVQTEITADFADVEGKVPAYLMFGGEYILQLKSTNQGDLILGTYTADTAGDKTIRLFDTDLGAEINDLEGGAYWYSNKVNDSGTLKIRAFYNDTTGTTSSVVVTILNETGDLVFNGVSFADSALFSYTVPVGQTEVLHNLTMTISNPTYGNRAFTKVFKPDESVTLPGSFEDPNTFRFIIIGIVVIFALMFTAATANMGAIILVGLAGILSVFGWYVISLPVLGLALLVAFAQAYKSGDKK